MITTGPAPDPVEQTDVNPRLVAVPGCTVAGCYRPEVARRLCSRHYYRLRQTGSPTGTLTRLTSDELADLLAEASAATGPGPCVVLPHKNRPSVAVEGRSMPASRAVWMAVHGDPGDLHVLHTCGHGTDGCIRLGHLYLGTQADNSRDAVAEGSSTRGQRNARAKLTDDAVREIRDLRAAGATQEDIARRFGVCRATVSLIAAGKTWTHLLPAASAS